MLRLFICIWIPENIKHDIIKFQEKLKELPMNIKLVEKENLHLTITFLGNVKEEKVNDIKKLLDKAIKDINEFHVKLREVKLIPSESYIRVIGINTIDEKDMLRKLIRDVGKTIGGSYHETTKLTLCRVKNISNKKIVKEFLEKNKHISFGEFVVKKVSLVKSTITRQGPVYETIYESSLS